MTKYIYNEHLGNFTLTIERKEAKELKPKLRKSNRMLVTKRYEPNALTYQQEHGLTGRVINMYDYFQNAVDVQPRDLNIRLSGIFDLSKVKIKGINPNESEVYQNGVKIANVAILPLTTQLIGNVTWVNPNGEPISCDLYDRRGFKSSTQYYHLDSSMGHQVIYDINGRIKIEIIVMRRDGKPGITSYKLHDYEGADYIFSDEAELWKFFKSELESNNQ